MDEVDGNLNPDFSSLPKEHLMELMQKRGAEVGDYIRERFESTQKLIHQLHTSTKKGIKPFREGLAHRREVFGENYIPLESFNARSVFRFFMSAVMDWVVIVLLVVSLLSLVLGLLYPEKCEGKEKFAVAWYEGVGILGTVFVMVLLAALADFLRDRDVRSLQDKINTERKASVIRDGKVLEILSKEVTVGDLCQLKVGSIVPADGLIIHQSGKLQMDEKLLGVQDPVDKNSPDEQLLFAGSHVLEGCAKIIVLAVGHNTELIRVNAAPWPGSVKIVDSKQVSIYGNSKRKDASSTLQGKINKLNYSVGVISIIAAVITILVTVIRFSVHTYCNLNLDFDPSHINEYIRAFIMGVVILILALPEGLPLVVNISMAFCLKKLYDNKCLVRHADTIEEMGNITTICCNKTGVLTENQMTVTKCYIADQMFEGDPRTYKGSIPNHLYDDLIKGIAINTSYSSSIESADENHLPKHIGNKTDTALLKLVLEFGDTYEMWRDEYPEEKFTKVYDFTPETKFTATVVREEQSAGYKLYVKGATEFVLAHCTKKFGADGQIQPISKDDQNVMYQNTAKKMQEEGLRILCLASRDFQVTESDGSEKRNWDNQEEVLSHLTLLAIVGIEDPVRDEVHAAIRQCKEAGITVRMVTKENIITAKSVALKCGILDPRDKHYIYTGRDFNDYIKDPDGAINMARFDAMWPQMPVLARAGPLDKFNLVNGIQASNLRAHGEVVAVTGAGVKDGPVLTIADVGFTMNAAGTDVARESSDVVLLNDDFSSIVQTVKWGRNVFETLLKFLQFEITVSVVGIVVVILGACILGRSPLVATQLLWANVIMDSLASLALTRENPSADILKRKPYGQHKPLITRSLLRNVIGHSIFQLVVMFVLIFRGADLLDIKDGFKPETFCKPSQHASVVFTTFVFMQLFNEINSRKVQERNVFQGICGNSVFIIIWIIQAVIQILIVQFFTTAFHVEGMDWQQWGWCLFLGFSELLWAQLVFTIPKKFVPVGLRCVSTGYPTGRGIAYLRSNSRVDQQDGGPIAALMSPTGGPVSPPLQEMLTFFEKWEESHEGGGQ